MEVFKMPVVETLPGIKGSFYSASLRGREQSVERIEQFWSAEGIRADYSEESELYVARDKRWLLLNHARKEVRYSDADDLATAMRLGSADEQKMLLFMQQMLQQAGIKVSPPKRWRGNYFGVSATFTQLCTVNGEVRFQLVLGRIDSWTVPLRLCMVIGDDSLFVRDTLSVRKQPVPKGLFAPPRDYKIIPHNSLNGHY
jgi:hypothetical protein